MEAWMKDVILPLLIAILAAVVGSCSLVLWKLLMEWWQRSARRSALRARTASPDADSGEQPLPQAEALHDIEMGPMKSGEVTNCPHSSSSDDPNAAEEQMDMMHN